MTDLTDVTEVSDLASLSLPTIPYRPRLTRSMGTVQRAGWTVKIIGITAGPELPDDLELAAAIARAEEHLPQPPRTDERPGIAFLIVHHGDEALWVIVAWWWLDILYQRLFRADPGSVALAPVPPDGPTACVWELLAIDHERQAWVTHVLARPDNPDFAGYLASTLDIAAP